MESECPLLSPLLAIDLCQLTSSDRAARRLTVGQLCERLQTATAELRRRSAGVPGPSSQPLLCRLTALWPALLPLLSDEAEAVRAASLHCLDALGQLWDAAEEGRAAVDGRPSPALGWLLPALTLRLSPSGGEKAEELRLQLLGCVSRALLRERQGRGRRGMVDGADAAVGDGLCGLLAAAMAHGCPQVRLAACEAVTAAWGGEEGSALPVTDTSDAPLQAQLLPSLLPLLRVQRWELRRAALHSLAALLPIAVVGAAAASAPSASPAVAGPPVPPPPPPLLLRLPPSLTSCGVAFAWLSSDEKPRVRSALSDCIGQALERSLSYARRRSQGGGRWTEEALTLLLTPLLTLAGSGVEEADSRRRCVECARGWLSASLLLVHLLPSLCVGLTDWTAAVRLRSARGLLGSLQALGDSGRSCCLPSTQPQPLPELLPPSALHSLVPPLCAALVDEEREVRDSAVACARRLALLPPRTAASPSSASAQVPHPHLLLPLLVEHLRSIQREGAELPERRVEGALHLLHLALSSDAVRGEAQPTSTADAVAVVPLCSSSSLSPLLLCLHDLRLCSHPPHRPSTRWQLLRLLRLCVDHLQPEMEGEHGQQGQQAGGERAAVHCSPVLLLFLCLHRLDCWQVTEAERGRAVEEEEEAALRSAVIALSRLMQGEEKGEEGGEAEGGGPGHRSLPHPAPLYRRLLPQLLPPPLSPYSAGGAGPASSSCVSASSLPSSALFLLLRRSVDCGGWSVSSSTFPSVLSLLSCAAAGEEEERASAVSVVAHLLTQLTHSTQPSQVSASSTDCPRALHLTPPFSSAAADALLCSVLVPASRWSNGGGNHLIRLHSLTCIHSLCAVSLTHSAHSHHCTGSDGGWRERGEEWTRRLLPLLRSNIDDELAQCRLLAARTLHLLLQLLSHCQPCTPPDQSALSTAAPPPPCAEPRPPLLPAADWAALLSELLHRLDDADDGVRVEALQALQSALQLPQPLAPPFHLIDPTSTLARHWAHSLALHAQPHLTPHPTSASSSALLAAINAALCALARRCPQAVQAAIEEAADTSQTPTPLTSHRTQSAHSIH